MNMLIFYLVIGRAIPIPGLPALPFFLVVWATLGFRRAALWSVLSQILDWRWWQLQFFQIGAISGFLDQMIKIIRLSKTDPQAAIAAAQQLNSSLPFHRAPVLPLIGSNPWPLVILEFVLIGVLFYLSVRRMRKLRRRLKPVIQKLPGPA